VVEEVVAWLETEIIAICSTVAVGTTQSLIGKTGKRIVFQPEFSAPGSPNHPFRNRRAVGWLILGGARADTQPVADLFKRVFGADLVIRHTDSRTAELAKYMENSFLATKVGFCNEFFDIARALGVDYDELRDLWLLDPRIGASHTLVFPDDRGFGGKCLPKDLDAIIATALANGCRPELLMSLRQANASLRRTDTPVPLPD
jgi:UDPglucose 6-dehydrogenase